MPPFIKFLTGLMEEGRVVVGMESVTADVHEAARSLLIEFEFQYRNSMAHQAPEFDSSIALAAATKYYQACQFTLNRDLDAKSVSEKMSENLTSLNTPEAHYSVDLVFRYLPDLARFARSASERDPLVEHLLKWANQWPLSSVGMTIDSSPNIDGFADHPALLQLYVDRIFKTGDVARLNDQRVKILADSNLGMFPDLCPKIAAALPRNEDST